MKEVAKQLIEAARHWNRVKNTPEANLQHAESKLIDAIELYEEHKNLKEQIRSRDMERFSNDRYVD